MNEKDRQVLLRVRGQVRLVRELNEKLDNAADAKAPETAEVDDAAEDGDAEKSEDFWEKDESQLKLDPPPADAAPTAPDYAAFQGVKFSE